MYYRKYLIIPFYLFTLILLQQSSVKAMDDQLQALRKNAEAGSDIAQFELGRLTLMGKGTIKDRAKAISWLKKSASKHNSDAENLLGECFLNGIGVPKSDRDAFYYFELSSNKGNNDARYNLGKYYLTNRISDKLEKGIELVQECANLGDMKAVGYLGECYLEGEFITQDNAKALGCFKDAADHGNLKAKLALWEWYQAKRKPEISVTRAWEELQMAVNAKYPPAFYEMGNCYLNGIRVNIDYVKALKYYKSADNNGISVSPSLITKVEMKIQAEELKRIQAKRKREQLAAKEIEKKRQDKIKREQLVAKEIEKKRQDKIKREQLAAKEIEKKRQERKRLALLENKRNLARLKFNQNLKIDTEGFPDDDGFTFRDKEGAEIITIDGITYAFYKSSGEAKLIAIDLRKKGAHSYLQNLSQGISPLWVLGSSCYEVVEYAQSIDARRVAIFGAVSDVSSLIGIYNLEMLKIRSDSLTSIDTFRNQLSNLDYLDLSWCRNLTRVGALKYMKNLRSINLNHCLSLDKAGGIENIKGLEYLDVRECPKITSKEVKKLRKRLPVCSVVSY